MIQLTPQMRIVAAVEPADFRRGIDGLARLCQDTLKQDPFSGWVFVFRNRPATALKILVYLCTEQPPHPKIFLESVIDFPPCPSRYHSFAGETEAGSAGTQPAKG